MSAGFSTADCARYLVATGLMVACLFYWLAALLVRPRQSGASVWAKDFAAVVVTALTVALWVGV